MPYIKSFLAACLLAGAAVAPVLAADSVPVTVSGSTRAAPGFSCGFDGVSSLALSFSARSSTDPVPLRIKCSGASESTTAHLSLSPVGPCSAFQAYVGPAPAAGSSSPPPGSTYTPVRIYLTNNGSSYTGARLDEVDVGRKETTSLNVIAYVRSSNGGEPPAGTLYGSDGVSGQSGLGSTSLYLFFGDTYVDPGQTTCPGMGA